MRPLRVAMRMLRYRTAALLLPFFLLGPAPRVRSMDPSVPAPLDELVAALLEKDPADRPQSGANVRTSLDPAMRQTGATRTVPIERVPREPTRRLPVLERVRRARSVSPAILIAPRAFSASSCSSRRSPARVRTAGQRSLAVAASGRLAHDGAALAAEGRRIVGAGGRRARGGSGERRDRGGRGHGRHRRGNQSQDR